MARITRPELEQAADDYEAMGAPAEVVAQIRAEARGEAGADDAGMAIHPDNVVAVKLFQAMSTQWLTQSLSTMTRAVLIRTGLNYVAIPTTARLSKLKITDVDFIRLRVLEGEALTAWREEAAAS